jgi:hypothetical protein
MSETKPVKIEISGMAPMVDMAGHFITLVEAIEAKNKGLSRLGAGLLAALLLDGAHDSRSFSKLFDIEHALVLREVTLMSAEGGCFIMKRRDERTQRCFYALSDEGEKLKNQLLT